MLNHLRRVVLGAFVLSAGFVALGTSHAAAGRMAGSASISQTGEAQYTIPIFTPPGSKGMAPQLALSYGHRAAEGLAGVGWGISGLSVISRCRKTFAQDGAPDGVYLTTADRFCLDGNQLKLVSGSYGVAGSTYRTEIDTFARITAVGTAGNGPASFTVEQANGLIYEYGNTADSRIESIATGFTTTARAWALNKIRDREGNAIVFTYQEDGAPNGDFRILNVDYTSNGGQGIAAIYRVAFTYATQPITDVESAYLAGGRVDDVKRLTQVDVTHNATTTLVRRYKISYVDAPVTGRSRIDTVTECAGSDTNCYPATSFDYQDGTAGFGSPVLAGTVNAPLAIDINGDGRTDVVYSTTATSGTGFWAYRLANTSGGYAAAVTSSISNHSFSQAAAIDYNADGRDDILVPCSAGTTWCVIQGTTGGLQTPINTGAPSTSASKAMPIDWNGDGLDDLLWVDIPFAYVRLRVWGSAFATSATTVRSDVSAFNNVADQARSRRRGLDVNGDGKRDFIYMQTSATFPPTLAFWVSLGGSTNVWSLSTVLGGNAKAIDINGDGYSDVVYGVSNSSVLLWRISTGASFGPQVTGPSLVGYDVDRAVGVDYDGDGYEDVVLPNTSVNRWYWLRSTGTGLVTTFADTGIATGSATSSFLVDANGDGLDDLAFVTSANEYKHLVHQGVQPDLLTLVTDAYGNTAGFTYGSTGSNTCVQRDTTLPAFPYQRYSGPVTVACTLSASDGVGGTYSVAHTFTNPVLHLQGRGLTGFEQHQVVDNRNNLIVTESIGTEFPHIGRRKSLLVKQPSPSTFKVAETVNTPNQLPPVGTGNQIRYAPFDSAIVTTEYGVGGGYDNVLLRTATTSVTLDPTSGVVSDTTTTVVESSLGNGVQPGASYVQRVYHPTIDNDTVDWCIGRPTQTQFINSHNQTNGAQLTRTVDRTWTSTTSACRLSQEVVEPSSATYKVTRDLGYDGFGNVNSETITGINMPARQTQVNWGTTGQFPNSVTNALGHVTSFGWDYAKGVRTTLTDPNNTAAEPVVTQWQYDPFGRATVQTNPDGTSRTWTWNYCATGCASLVRMYVAQADKNISNGTIREDTFYFDPYDRLIYEYRRNLDGSMSIVRRDYNAQGVVYREYFPWPDSGSSVGYASATFDVLNRPLTLSRPVSASDATLQTTTVAYEGLTTRVTDPLSKQSIKVENVLGAVVRSTDHAGYYQTFDFDAFGSLKRVQDSLANTLFQASYAYGIAAHRTQTIDMNMGTWNYVINALGEVTRQTDAKAQQTDYVYDLLGRLDSRTEPEGVTDFVWGNSAASKNIGRLASVSGPGYSEAYTFDSRARLSQRRITADAANFDYNYAYATATGLLDTLTYPLSLNPSTYRLKLQYAYQYGILNQITDFNAPTTVFWTANAMNARGQITQETAANGLITNRAFDSVSGFLASIQKGTAGNPTLRQNVGYLWDKVGNLTQRQDNAQGLTENFYFDNLYRLDYSTRKVGAGAPVTNLDLTYDAGGMGNITGKTSNVTGENVGTGWTYDATKKHQVTAAGGFSFTYDNNGNMLTGRGITYTWKSYNLPATITSGSLNATFSYAPDRSYWKQVAQYSGVAETTLYLGGLLEKVTRGAATEFRHRILTPGAISLLHDRRSDGTNATYSISGDHLGSASIVTDSAQALVVNESFGAFGQRRGSDWQGVPTAGQMTTIDGLTRRGFTDHTMLDNLNLIHMNGRVYDPVIGRFASADPYVQAPEFTQSFNRYSYTFNNPLSYTDPSGFGADGVTGFPQLGDILGALPNVGITPAGPSAIFPGAEPMFGPQILDAVRASHPDVVSACKGKIACVYRQIGPDAARQSLIDYAASLSGGGKGTSTPDAARNAAVPAIGTKLPGATGAEFNAQAQSTAAWIGEAELRIDDFAARGGFLSFYLGRVVQEFVMEPVRDVASAVAVGDKGALVLAGAAAIIKPIRAVDKLAGAARGLGSLDDLSRAAGALDRGGLSAAGRQLQKHGSRQGGAFPAARGNPSAINQQGQQIVDDILTTPGATTVGRHHARFGDVIEIRAPDGRGLRYGSDGRFLGFLEPRP